MSNPMDNQISAQTDAKTSGLPEIQEFLEYRESILKVIGLYDKQIAATIALLTPQEKTLTFLQSVKTEQNLHESLIQAILELDKKITTRIEEERNRLLQEISNSEKNAKIAKKFRSKWIPEPGENLDGKL